MMISLLEAVRRTGISHWRLSQLVASEKLPAQSVNGFLMVSEDDLRRYVIENLLCGRPAPAERSN